MENEPGLKRRQQAGAANKLYAQQISPLSTTSGCSGHSSVTKFLKEMQIIVILIFVFELSNLKKVNIILPISATSFLKSLFL